MISFPRRGLYAITQCDGKTPDRVVIEVADAIKGGAAVIQYRDKTGNDKLALAKDLVNLCHANQIPLIVNDDVGLALQVEADGVHLGKDDGNIRHARTQLGEDAIIGVSCYNDVERAVKAQAAGASYVAFGRFFPSKSKPLASPAELETLTKAKALVNLPIIAIGGILPDNGGQLLAAGADVLAVIGGVFDCDPELSAGAFQPLFA